MRLREIFGLIVRLVGLFFAAYGLYQLVQYLFPFAQGMWSILHTTSTASDWFLEVVATVLPGLLMIAAGWFILKKSDSIVAFTYRDNSKRCPKCGYDIRASTDRCPECGTAIERA